MPWRILVEALPGAAPIEATPLEVEAPSWVVALRTARELLGYPPPDPRELAVEVRDNLWRVADRSVGRLFVVESLKPVSVQMQAPELAPPSPPDILCEVRARHPKTEAQPFEYIEEMIVAQRLESLDVARTWLKLRLAAWRNFRGSESPRFLLRLFAFAETPASDDTEPVAYAELRSWSGKIELLPPEDSVASVVAGAQGVATSPAIRAARPPSANVPRAHVPTPVDIALVGAVVAPPARSSSTMLAANEDLIGAIFDSVHDVHFAPTVLDGSDLVCDIAFRNVPCAAAFVHLHDINNAGWIVASGSGDGATRVLGTRHPSTDPLFTRLTQRGASLRVSGGECTHELGVATSHAALALASVGGRFYGAIELLAAPGAPAFTEAQEHALAYLAEQFATFAASRGILVRENDILARRP